MPTNQELEDLHRDIYGRDDEQFEGPGGAEDVRSTKVDTDNGDAGRAGNQNPAYTPQGNLLLNTTAVTATPVTYWPSNNTTGSIGDPSYRDIPQTAGIGKYSKQSIKKTALNLPCVIEAIRQGKSITLNSSYSVNGVPMRGSQTLFKGLAMPGATPESVTVTFSGSLNNDGSQAAGIKACFSSSCGSTIGTSGNIAADLLGIQSQIDQFNNISQPNSNTKGSKFNSSLSQNSEILDSSDVLKNTITLYNQGGGGLSKGSDATLASKMPSDKDTSISTLYLDIYSGRYLGALKDPIDFGDEGQKATTFPNLSVNLRAMPKYYFDQINSGKITQTDEEYKTAVNKITLPIKIIFKKICDDFDKVCETQRDKCAELKFENSKKDKDKIDLPVEDSMLIYYSAPKEGTLNDNSITSVILENKYNKWDQSTSLRIYQKERSIPYKEDPENPGQYSKIPNENRYFFVTKDYYKEAEDIYFGRLTGDAAARALEKMVEKNKLVICDSHTHPCMQQLVFPGTGTFVEGMSKRYEWRSEHSAEDKRNAEQSGKPDMVLTFDATYDGTNAALSEIAIIRKIGDPLLIGDKRDISGSKLQKHFRSNIESIMLRKIIKEYYYGMSKPD